MINLPKDLVPSHTTIVIQHEYQMRTKIKVVQAVSGQFWWKQYVSTDLLFLSGLLTVTSKDSPASMIRRRQSYATEVTYF